MRWFRVQVLTHPAPGKVSVMSANCCRPGHVRYEPSMVDKANTYLYAWHLKLINRRTPWTVHADYWCLWHRRMHLLPVNSSELLPYRLWSVCDYHRFLTFGPQQKICQEISLNLSTKLPHHSVTSHGNWSSSLSDHVDVTDFLKYLCQWPSICGWAYEPMLACLLTKKNAPKSMSFFKTQNM